MSTFKHIINQLNDAIIIADLSNNISFCNLKAEQLFGYSSKQIIGKNLTILFPDEKKYLEKFSLLKLLKKHNTYQFKRVGNKKNNEKISLSIQLQAIKNKEGEMEEILFTFKKNEVDLNKESKLYLSESKYKALFNQANDSIFIHEFKTKGFSYFIDINKKACKEYGYTKQEFLKLTPVDISSSQDSDREGSARSRKKLAEEGHIVFEAVHINKQKKTFRVEISSNIYTFNNKKYIFSIVRNIEERKKTEELIIRYQNIFSTTNEALAYINSNYEYTDVNNSYCAIYKKTKSEIIGKKLETVLGKENFEKNTKNHIDVALSGKGYHNDIQIVSKDNKTLYLSINYIPFYSSQKKISGVVLSIQNITAQKNAKNAYIEQKKLLLTVINTIPNQVFWKDTNMLFLGCNNAFAEANHLKDTQSIIGKSDYELPISKKRADIFRNQDIKLLESGQAIYDIESSKIDENGLINYELTSKVPIINQQNEIIGLIGICTDITESRKMEIQMAKSEEKYRLLAENSIDVIWATDTHLKFIYSSKSTERLFGYTVKEREDKNIQIQDLYTQESLNIINKAFDKQYKEYLSNPKFNKRVAIELEAIHKDGHHFWVGISAAFYFDKNGQFAGIQGTTRDITQEVEYRKQLIIAKEKAEESDRLKSAFLASVSHELRTPLNAIIGFSSLIEEGKPMKKLLEYSHIINTSGNHLLKIMESIFNIALLQSKESKIEIESINIQSLFNDIKIYALSELKRSNKQNIEIIYNNENEKEFSFDSDRSKLTQLLTNLINNAVKYTNQGSINYGYSIINKKLRFFVKDTGIGIKKEKFQIIFDKFTQVEEKESEVHGVGLGLAICKEISELLNGKIWLESEPTKGTIFYFEIAIH